MVAIIKWRNCFVLKEQNNKRLRLDEREAEEEKVAVKISL